MSDDAPTHKQCTKCRETKPLEEFSKNKNMKDGRQGNCKSCYKAYCAANREAIRIRSQAYRKANAEHMRVLRKTWWDAHAEKMRDYLKVYGVTYRAAHLEKMREYQAQYRITNADKIRQSIDRWVWQTPMQKRLCTSVAALVSKATAATLVQQNSKPCGLNMRESAFTAKASISLMN